jgi:feruloyl esterase
MRKAVLALIAVPSLAFGGAQGASATTQCADLLRLAIPHAQITFAERVAPGQFSEPGGAVAGRSYSDLPAFCRVHGVARPGPDSRIGFEIWLPLGGWSGRLHMVGNGAYDADIYWPQMADRIRQNDVAVATDTGHEGRELTFGVGHPARIIDWAQRSVHESVVAAKLIAVAHFGKPPHYAYFSGCSTGGAEALSEAQRYPDDFDGIIAGDPGNYRTALNLAFLWQFERNHHKGDNAHPILSTSDLKLLREAVLQACDLADGVKDGVINDPRECGFDVASLLCKTEAAQWCLSQDQVAAARAMYEGPRDPDTGAQIYPGLPFGSEGVEARPGELLPGWAQYWANPHSVDEPQRVDFFRYWVFDNPHWNWWDFNWHTDPGIGLAVMSAKVDAVSPDLQPFAAHGGKLIMFMGWADPVGSALAAIDYYRHVEAFTAHHTGLKDATAATQRFFRLYMIPGMAHCAGGPGATHFSTATRDSTPPVSDATHDMTVAIEDWVEKHEAPGALIGTHYTDDATKAVAFQRPLCVFPEVARYIGGDVNSAASFRCEAVESGSRVSPKQQ